MDKVYELTMCNGDTEYKRIRVSLHKTMSGAEKKKKELKSKWLNNGDTYTTGELSIKELTVKN